MKILSQCIMLILGLFLTTPFAYADGNTTWGFSYVGDPFQAPARCHFTAVLQNIQFNFNCSIRLPKLSSPVWQGFPGKKPTAIVLLPGWGGTSTDLGWIQNNFADGIGGHPDMIALAIDLTHSYTGVSPGDPNDHPTSNGNLLLALMGYEILRALDIADLNHIALYGYSRGSITAAGVASLAFNPYRSIHQQSGGISGDWWQLPPSFATQIKQNGNSQRLHLYNCDGDNTALLINAQAEANLIQRPAALLVYPGCGHTSLFTMLQHFIDVGNQLRLDGFFP